MPEKRGLREGSRTSRAPAKEQAMNFAAMMPRDKAFYDRTAKGYSNMKRRFGPRYWKSGSNKGRMRFAGYTIPFTLEQYQEWYLAQLGGTVDGTCKCRYCPKILTALDAETDHIHPVKQGGSLGLENLALACGTCNRFKGGMTEDGFNALKEFLRVLANTCLWDSAEIEQRLKGPIAYHKSARAEKKAKRVAPQDDEPF